METLCEQTITITITSPINNRFIEETRSGFCLLLKVLVHTLVKVKEEEEEQFEQALAHTFSE